MPRLKLTKTVVDSAQPDKNAYELRDAATPGFLLKVTPTGRKVFMVAYVANNGQRRKPAIGRFGEITLRDAHRLHAGRGQRRPGACHSAPCKPRCGETGVPGRRQISGASAAPLHLF